MTPPDDTGPSAPTPIPRCGQRRALRHRTWPERLAILGTFLSAGLCFLVALALVGGYLVARQRNVVDLENPADRAVARAAAAEAPIIVLAGQAGATTAGPSTTAAGTGSTTTAAAAAQASTPSDAPAATESAPAAATRPPHRARQCADGDVPARRSRSAELPHHRRRQRRVRRSRTRRTPAPSATARTWASAATRSWCCRVDPSSKRVAMLVVPPRPLRRDRRHRQQVAHQLGLPARRAAAPGRHDLQQLRRRRSTTTSRSTSAPSRRSSTRSAASRCRSSTRPGTPTPGSTCPHAGCYAFDGETALAYVRSRYYEYEDPPGSGNWQPDRHQRPWPDLAAAGLPAPGVVERARQGPAQPARRPRPDPRRDARTWSPTATSRRPR